MARMGRQSSAPSHEGCNDNMSAAKENWDLLQRFTDKSLDYLEKEFISIHPDLANKLIDDIYGYAYRRGHISEKTRHLITIGVISAMGGCENQLNFQLRAALNLGIPKEEIMESIIQVSVFAGNARAINAAAILHSITSHKNTQKKR